MIVRIDGKTLKTEKDFHIEIAKQLDFGPYYGQNLNALWDFLGTAERPITLIWEDALASKASLGQAFSDIVDTLRAIENKDSTAGKQKRFELQLH